MRDRFGLYLVLTEPVAGYERCAAAAVECGVAWVQLRMKREPPDERRRIAERIREITRGSATGLIINDDLALAREVSADGLHLGQGDPPGPAEARRQWGRVEVVIGLSTHNAAQAARARELGADYVGVGPVFATPTKPDGDPPLGPVAAARAAELAGCPAVAIGGIDATNLEAVLRAGFVNFAVVRAVGASLNPAAEIRRLQRIWWEVVGGG
ncbi:MAG: thiamine phosphate synthase [Kiritimatiellae bacterium]|nr:thiamine phosphate synthase [Kiritimatiellia bacterium]